MPMGIYKDLIDIPPLNILLVEDNKINQMIAKKLLDKKGHKVTIANNGQEAVNIASSHFFDVILMDLHMPVMDGHTATKKIRQLSEPYNSVPIVAMTALTQNEQSEECKKSGMNGFLTKPFHPQDMDNVLYSFTNDNYILRNYDIHNEKEGDYEFLQTIISEFGEEYCKDYAVDVIKELDQLVEDLSDYIKHNETGNIISKAHDIRGLSANLGMEESKSISRTIELNAEKFTPKSLEKHYKSLTSTLKIEKDQLNHFLNQINA
jgi:CheY-like chemotaxis protein